MFYALESPTVVREVALELLPLQLNLRLSLASIAYMGLSLPVCGQPDHSQAEVIF